MRTEEEGFKEEFPPRRAFEMPILRAVAYTHHRSGGDPGSLDVSPKESFKPFEG
jgi:hypothetical protein